MNINLIIKPVKISILALLSIFILTCVLTVSSILLLDYVKPSGLFAVTPHEKLVIDNVNIVDPSNNEVLRNRQVTIENGIISEINIAKTPFENSKFIDGEGDYLTPGLMDMHVHMHDRKHLMLTLAHGVTTVRSLRGQPKHLRWKNELENNEWLGSNLYSSSPVLAGAGTHALNQEVLTPEDGANQVKLANSKGYDSIKVYGDLDAKTFESIMNTAKKLNIPVAKHAPLPAQGSHWQYIENIQSLEHVEDIFQGLLNYEFDANKLQGIALQIKKLNTPFVPTLETFNHLTQLSVHKQSFIDTLPLEYLNPLYFDIERLFSVSRWLEVSEEHANFNKKELNFLLETVKALHDHNVKLLVGSDTGTMYTIPGIATHNEIKLMKQAGLPNYKILQAATINAAEALGVENKYGSIDVGKIADLVLSNQNPLKNIETLQQPTAVIKNGQYIDKKTLNLIKDSAKEHSYYWSVIALLEDLLTRFVFS